MTNPTEHEGRIEEPSLEEKVIAIFHDSRTAFLTGYKNFQSYETKNPYRSAVQEALGGLATPQLVEVIATGQLSLPEGQQDPPLTGVVSNWTRYETARMLHSEAYGEYIDRQNDELREVLDGMRITVTAREGASTRVISPSDGHHVVWSDSNPKEVGGMFHRTNVSVNELVLVMDEPLETELGFDRYWVVRVVDGDPDEGGIHQQVDLKIENPDLPPAA